MGYVYRLMGALRPPSGGIGRESLHPRLLLDAVLLMEWIEHRHSPLSVDNQANASQRVPDYVSCLQSSRLTLYGNWFTVPAPPNSILLDFTSPILWPAIGL